MSDTKVSKIKIERGIHLVVSDVLSLEKEDILICDGTHFFSDEENTSPYQKNAILPNKNWRTVNETELAELTSGIGISSYHNTVAVVPIEKVLNGDISVSYLSNLSKVEMQNNQTVSETLHALYDTVDQYNTAQYKIFNGIAVNSPNLSTVTFNEDTDSYLGLHIDSFDGGNIAQRNFSSNRICINVSSEDRFFLYINKTLSQLIEDIERLSPISIDKSDHILFQKLPFLFSSVRPDYPVIKIRCRPGMAYIAPTENIIHDGASTGQTSSDISVSIRGFFFPTPQKIINDSLNGDYGLLGIDCLLNEKECREFLDFYKNQNLSESNQSNLVSNVYCKGSFKNHKWHKILTKRLQTYFDDSDMDCLILLDNDFEVHHYKQGAFTKSQLEPVLESDRFCSRYCLLIYLNDNFLGGETIFPQISSIINPRQGNAILFSKAYQHKQGIVKEGNKFILLNNIAVISN